MARHSAGRLKSLVYIVVYPQPVGADSETINDVRRAVVPAALSLPELRVGIAGADTESPYFVALADADLLENVEGTSKWEYWANNNKSDVECLFFASVVYGVGRRRPAPAMEGRGQRKRR